jgi:hypothetical protein
VNTTSLATPALRAARSISVRRLPSPTDQAGNRLAAAEGRRSPRRAALVLARMVEIADVAEDEPLVQAKAMAQRRASVPSARRRQRRPFGTTVTRSGLTRAPGCRRASTQAIVIT